jgi:hypothetical protein
MAVYTYEIGASTAAMSNVEDLLTNSKFDGIAPKGMAVRPYAYYHEAASGLSYGDGYPYTEWRFDALGEADKNVLDGYLNGGQSRRLYIRTRDEDGSYTLYEAVMHRPKQTNEARHETLLWRDLVYRFTMLVEQEEEEEE